MLADNGNTDFMSMSFIHPKYNHSKWFDFDMFVQEYSKYLNARDHWNYTIPDDGTLKMCLPTDSKEYYIKLNGQKYSTAGMEAIGHPTHVWHLNNGACIGMTRRGGWEYGYDAIVIAYIDVNGNPGPNQFGKDTFFFTLEPDGTFLPVGAKLPLPTVNVGICDKTNWVGGINCANKILQAGWRMKSDYPW